MEWLSVPSSTTSAAMPSNHGSQACVNCNLFFVLDPFVMDESVELMRLRLASFVWVTYATTARRSATHSTCCVCGNMSSGVTFASVKTPSAHKMFKSRAIVAG